MIYITITLSYIYSPYLKFSTSYFYPIIHLPYLELNLSYIYLILHLSYLTFTRSFIYSDQSYFGYILHSQCITFIKFTFTMSFLYRLSHLAYLAFTLSRIYHILHLPYLAGYNFFLWHRDKSNFSSKSFCAINFP